MKVQFINPAREGFFLITERQAPMGIFYLAESCRKEGFEVEIIDMLVGDIIPETIPFNDLSDEQKDRLASNPIFNDYVRYGMRDEDVIKKIEKYQPSVICISIMFSCFHDSAERLAQKIKKRFPHVVIIAGGAHVTTNYKDVLSTGVIDYCLQYEGEKTLPKLLRLIEAGVSVESVDGIAFGQNPIVVNTNHTWITSLDEYHPAYDLILPEDYHETITIITSRGCPFACEFCTVHLSMGKAYRARSVQNVVDELEVYTRKGFKRFNIEDDNFTFDINRVKAICDRIIEKNIKCSIYLLNGITVQNLNEECIQRMAAAGVRKLFLGLETTADNLLSVLKKKHTSLQQIKTAVHICKAYGINAGASLIIGFPSQTIEDILVDISTLIIANIPIYAFNPLYPLPGTEIYHECIKQGMLTGKEDYIFLGSDNFIIHNDSFSREDLYYLWVSVKGFTKWGFLNGKYMNLDSIGIKEALTLIADALGGEATNYSLGIQACRINADMISSHYKVFADMTRCFVYLLTGQWYGYTIREDNEIMIHYYNTNSNAPRSIVMLRETIKAGHKFVN